MVVKQPQGSQDEEDDLRATLEDAMQEATGLDSRGPNSYRERKYWIGQNLNPRTSAIWMSKNCQKFDI